MKRFAVIVHSSNLQSFVIEVSAVSKKSAHFVASDRLDRAHVAFTKLVVREVA